MKWTEWILDLKRGQYTQKQALDRVKYLFKNKKKPFTEKHQKLFDLTWRMKVQVEPTVEDVVPEVDLPNDLAKMQPYQETQVLNYFKSLDREEIERRWKLINIALNLAHAKKRKKDIAAFTKLSDIIYKTKMLKHEKVQD